jgi:hypothetical protein
MIVRKMNSLTSISQRGKGAKEKGEKKAQTLEKSLRAFLNEFHAESEEEYPVQAAGRITRNEKRKEDGIKATRNGDMVIKKQA